MQRSFEGIFRLTQRAIGRLARQPQAGELAARSAMADVFTDIYRTNTWGNAESRSGPGSTVKRSEPVRRALEELITALNVKTLLDAPCGDFNWMKEVSLPKTRYIGLDVVRELIERNQQRYGCRSREFKCLDITADSLPRADLIFCRDCLVHLSVADVAKALRAFKRSGTRFLAATTFPSRNVNEEIATGGWRPLNLEQAPFHLPPPLQTISDGCPVPEYADKALGLWDLSQVPA